MIMRVSVPVAGLLAIVLLLVGVTDTPVRGAAAGQQGGGPAALAPNPPWGNGKWAGWVAGTQPGAPLYSSVSARFTVPDVICRTKRDLYGIWVGLGGAGLAPPNDWLVQIGVVTDCDPTHEKYFPFYERVDSALPMKKQERPQRIDSTIRPGDKIFVKVLTDNNGRWGLLLEINDHLAFSMEFPLDAIGSTAEAIVESPIRQYPNFGQVDFTDFQIDDQPADLANPLPFDSTNRTLKKFTASTGPLHGDPIGFRVSPVL
jgi:hypothetical protein